MLTDLFRNWALVVESTYYDDNRYTTYATQKENYHIQGGRILNITDSRTIIEHNRISKAGKE